MDRIQVLKEFIEKEPNDPFNKYALAMEYISQQNEEAGSLLFQELLTKHSAYLPTYYQAAHFYWEQGDLVQAEKIFREGIELAQKMNEHKTLAELKNAYRNFQFETEE